MQSLAVNLTIPIPEDHILISKVELADLKEQAVAGRYWTLKDIEIRTGYRGPWIKDNILYKPKFRKVLDVEQGGFVYYPRSSGEKWTFLASKMTEFLEFHFKDIFKTI